MDSSEMIRDLEAQARAKGLSISDVCQEAGVARSTFTRWKAGSHEPNMRTFQKISEAIAAAPKLAPPEFQEAS